MSGPRTGKIKVRSVSASFKHGKTNPGKPSANKSHSKGMGVRAYGRSSRRGRA